jgi:hypothetical protein
MHQPLAAAEAVDNGGLFGQRSDGMMRLICWPMIS